MAEPLPLTTTMNYVLHDAEKLARRLGDKAVGTEHVLTAMTYHPSCLAAWSIAETDKQSQTTVLDELAAILDVRRGLLDRNPTNSPDEGCGVYMVEIPPSRFTTKEFIHADEA